MEGNLDLVFLLVKYVVNILFCVCVIFEEYFVFFCCSVINVSISVDVKKRKNVDFCVYVMCLFLCLGC